MSFSRFYFEAMNVSELSSLLSVTDTENIPKSAKKAEKIAILIDYYNDNNLASKIWNQLNDYEKEFLTCIVQTNYSFEQDQLDAIATKHKVEVKKYYGKKIYYNDNSKLRILMPKGYIPRFIADQLEKIITPYKPSISAMEDFIDIDNEYYEKIINRENRYSDFDMLIKFVNSKKVDVAKSTGLMGRANLIKFHQICNYDEIFQNEIFNMSKIKTANDTVVSLAMMQLLLASDVLKIKDDKYVLGKQANKFISLDVIKKATFLFEAYLSDKKIINEHLNITANKYTFSRKKYDLTKSRNTIIEMLKLCPIDKWIDGDVFKKEIKRNNFYFLRDEIDNVLIRDDYSKQYYTSPSWYELEYYFIDIVLMYFLATIGIIDVYSYSGSDNYGIRTFPVIECFKITNLGKRILGLVEDVELISRKNNDSKKLIITSDFQVKVSGNQKIIHEVYLENFLAKITETDSETIYKLDFSSMIKALEQGITIKKFIDYLIDNVDSNIPSNVLDTLNDWELQSHLITIRNVTIIESKDTNILNKIKNYKEMKEIIVGEVNEAIIINPTKVDKAKKAIEKHKHFVLLK